MQELFNNDEGQLKDRSNHIFPHPTSLEISADNKNTAAEPDQTGAQAINGDTLLLSNHGSKKSDGTTVRALYCSKKPMKTVDFEGHCQIGKQAEVEDSDVHTMQERLTYLSKSDVVKADVVLWVDNQNAMRALSSVPTTGQEYRWTLLEEVKILQH